MLVTQQIASLLGGVSQRAQELRHFSQAEEQINAVASFARGLLKRPPTEHVGKLVNDPTGYDDAFVHSINRDQSERYHIVVANGIVQAFDALTATPVTVLTPDGTAYLVDSADAGFRAVTVGDTTILVNRGMLTRRGTTMSPAAINEALVYVRQADYGTNYKVTLDGHDIIIRTVDGSSAASRPAISTDMIASDLMTAMQADAYLTATYTFTLYGSTIYIAAKNPYHPIIMTTTDGLADHGLKAVIRSVQSFDDLPARAKAGMVVQITGQPGNKYDNYYVRYDDSDSASESGVWRECPKPGVLLDFDKTTMPHRLVRKGNVLKDARMGGISRNVIIHNGMVNVLSGGWTKTGGGLVLAPASDQLLQNHGDAVIGDLPGADGTRRHISVSFDIDTTDVAAFVNSVVEIRANTGPSTAFNTVLTSRSYRAGRSLENEVIETDATLVTGAQIKVTLTYTMTDGSTNVLTQYRKAVLNVHGTYNLAGDGIISQQITSMDATFTATDVYPVGTAVTIRVNDATDFTHTVGSSNETGAQVATALAALVDAHASYVATNPSGGVVRVSMGGASVPLVVTVTPDPTVFYDPNLNMVANEHAGRTLYNTTDGSSGTILSNTATTIKVNALTGGSTNVFNPGDRVGVKQAGRYFVFEAIQWENREVGDDDTAKYPSFVDSAISSVFFYANRLAFTSGENIILSRSGDLYNFFRKTAIDVLDDDPIDVASAHREISIFHDGVLWNEGQYLFADSAQFSLSGEPALTPKTVRLDLVGRYPNATAFAPVVLGKRLYFTRARNGYTQVFEMSVNEYGNMSEAFELAEDLPTYLAGNPVAMTGDAALGYLFVLTDANGQSNLYVHRQHFGATGQRDMSSWGRWAFPAGSRILALDCIDGKLGLLVKRTDGVFFEQMTLETPVTGIAADRVTYLDRRLTQAGVTMVYAGGNTTITLPFSVPTDGSQGTVMVGNRTTGAVYAVTRPSATQVVVTGADVRAASLYIGIFYSWAWTPTAIFYRASDGSPITQGRLALHYLDVFYRDTTDLTVTVTPEGRSGRTTAVAQATPTKGRLRVSVRSRAETTPIVFTSSQPGPCSVHMMEWEGEFTKRSVRPS